MSLAVNFDGVGQRLAANSIATFNLDEAAMTLVEGARTRYRDVVPADPWPQSNHYTFFSRGVPTIAFTNAGGASVAHRPDDDERWLDEPRLVELVDFAFELAVSFQTRRRGGPAT